MKDKGFSGAKLNPNDWGTFPLDAPMLMPIYEVCEDLQVPIHIHTGVDPTGRIEYGNPILLDKVARVRKAISAKDSAVVPAGLTWTPEAQKLADQIPGFIRGSAVRRIEDYARKQSITIVTAEVMEKAMHS